MPMLRGLASRRSDRTTGHPDRASAVLLGKIDAGNRLMLPLDDPEEISRVHIAAQDALAKRIVVRLAGAGERITVHTRDPQRWVSVRMPDIAVGSQARPMRGTTVSVVDGTVTPAPRPNTLISIGEPGTPYRGSADALITQIGPATVDETAGGQLHTVEVELFRAENRYISSEPTTLEDNRARTGVIIKTHDNSLST